MSQVAGLLQVTHVARVQDIEAAVGEDDALALLAAALDLRMIVRGGVQGAARIARHLWRMCAAWFIATTSLFVGQPQLFSYAVRRSGVLIVPSVVIVALLLFWLARVLFTRAYRRPAVLPATAAE
jgi:hypothetical protein